MPEHSPAPSPSRAVYGFAMFLSFRVLFVLYMVWAIFPENWFQEIGITCLPQRYWAVAVPIFLLTVLAIFAFFIYPNLGLYLTPKIDDLKTITDSTSVRKQDNSSSEETVIGHCNCVNTERCFRNDFEHNSGDFINRAIPALEELNICEVSQILYTK